MKKSFFTKEEKEFIGSFLCCIAFCGIMFLTICIFH